jgi:shikimate dehydrogenase
MNSAPDQYGVFGHPIGHSLSPFIHGMFARETAQQMSYRPFDVPPEQFTERAREFFAGGGRGLNITLPHKLAAVEAAHDLTPRATHAGAVNTLALQGNRLLGDNTDGAGLVRDLCDNHKVALGKRRLLVLGAGGATRGVLAPLLEEAPEIVVIANRSAERAEQLATAFADLGTVHGVGFEGVGGEPFDLIINATSASLSGDLPPIPQSVVGKQTVCYDLAYGKAATAFVKWAQSCGCARALQGIGMLVEQAAESFFLWRGVRPPTAHVLSVLKERAGA